jgi:hypothetical protein
MIRDNEADEIEARALASLENPGFMQRVAARQASDRARVNPAQTSPLKQPGTEIAASIPGVESGPDDVFLMRTPQGQDVEVHRSRLDEARALGYMECGR